MPVGMWMRRTAEEVLLTFWPPAPLARYTSILMSSGVDLHLDGVVDLRHDLQRREGGVAAAGRIERRDAHEAVHTVFALQKAVSVLALDQDAGALEAGFLAVEVIERCYLVAVTFRPAVVHAVKHLGPVLRSVPPAPAWKVRIAFFESYSPVRSVERRCSSSEDLTLASSPVLPATGRDRPPRLRDPRGPGRPHNRYTYFHRPLSCFSGNWSAAGPSASAVRHPRSRAPMPSCRARRPRWPSPSAREPQRDPSAPAPTLPAQAEFHQIAAYSVTQTFPGRPQRAAADFKESFARLGGSAYIYIIWDFKRNVKRGPLLSGISSKNCE